MTPSQRQLIKEAYQEGYYQALDEGVGGFFRFLRSLFKGGDAEFGIGYLFDDFKRFIDPPGVIGKIGFDDLP